MIKNLSVIRKNNKYFASFNCEVESKTLPKKKREIGIDLGLTHFIATSEGELINNPKYLKQSEKKLELKHQIVSRRIKGSHRRRKAIKLLVNTYEKISNQRKDFLHKLSRTLINEYDLMAIEKLKIKSMLEGKKSNDQTSLKRNLNRNVNDAGWNIFVNYLIYKAAEAGKVIKFVNPRNTSQTCSNCQKITVKKLSLKDRIFKCEFCHFYLNKSWY